MEITGLHHIGLYVTDMPKSLSFYVDGLGGTVTRSFPYSKTGETIYMVELCPGAVVELLPKPPTGEASDGRWAHIALSTTDIHALFEKMCSVGATVKYEINEMEHMYNAFLFGPEGETIELMQEK